MTGSSGLGLAAVTVAFVVAAAWRPGIVPIWLAAMPAAVLAAAFTGMSVYVLLMSHESWRRWRRDRGGR